MKCMLLLFKFNGLVAYQKKKKVNGLTKTIEEDID